MPVTKRLRRPGGYRAIALAVLVHAIVIGLLIVSFRWTSEPQPGERVMQATAIKEEPQTARKTPDDAQEAQRHREAEEAKKRQEAERQRQAELKRREEEARKRKLEQEKQRAEAARKKREAEEARKRTEAERQRQAELKRREEEARKKREAEQALKESLAAEERQRQEAAQAARAATEAEKFKALIRQKVSRNWSEPPGTGGQLQCVVQVRLVPGGEIVSVKIVQSSGNEMFDRSVENAVHKSTPLPLPEDPALFEYLREIEFIFRPTG